MTELNFSASRTLRRNPVSISVFFPCYNEQGNVERVVRRAVEVCEELEADFEIIIVDDGSADGTGRIADALAAADSRVRVVHHSPNLGYGAALQSGFRAATKAFSVFYRRRRAVRHQAR